jgi:hypothetical protein
LTGREKRKKQNKKRLQFFCQRNLIKKKQAALMSPGRAKRVTRTTIAINYKVKNKISCVIANTHTHTHTLHYKYACMWIVANRNKIQIEILK